MTYKFRDMVVMLFLGMIIGVAIVGATIADARGGNGVNHRVNDAEGIAQCISEYDYTHPKGNRFNILVRAIRWCNVIDAATAHECIAPCMVVLPKGTLEDEFGFDYGWRGHRPVVGVWARR